MTCDSSSMCDAFRRILKIIFSTRSLITLFSLHIYDQVIYAFELRLEYLINLTNGEWGD